MLAKITHRDTEITIDLSKPIDISLLLTGDENNVLAWSQGMPVIAPVQLGDFVGSVAKGSAVNFNNIVFNPHAHSTHTECIGHITEEFYNVNDSLKTFFFLAELITIVPDTMSNGDEVITKQQLQKLVKNNDNEALVIRTFPNTESKKNRHYSDTNPPYITEDCAEYIREIGIKHLLIDLPSVDKERDDGALLAHKAFWNFNDTYRLDATITELIYVPDHVKDGSYVLNLQIVSFENDASPSKPILYKTIFK